MELTKHLAKAVGNKIGVNWKSISLDDFFKMMKHEESEMKYMNKNELEMSDYIKIGKIAKAHLNESRLRKSVSFIIKESLNTPDFYNRLKYEINKGDSAYELEFNKTLGKYGVDSPDQLDEKTRDEFYLELDNNLKGHVEPVQEKFNYKIFSNLLKEGKIDRGKIFKEHGVFLTFQELALLEVAPPGREDQVKKLKQKFPKDVAYKIAWSQASDAKSKDNPEGKPEEKNEGEDLTPDAVASDKLTTKPISPINKESEEIVEPDTKGKEVIKEKDKKEKLDNGDSIKDKQKDEIAFSTGLQGDRYDKTPTGDRFVKAPGQHGAGSETKKGIRSKISRN